MNEMITIPREEYDRLREAAEDLEDVLAYRAAVADRREGIPSEIVDRILDGEPPVRAFRAWRGLSAAELARRSGVHPVQVHEIETGKKRGGVDTLKRLADSLGVRLDDVA